jgi:hypothetical protein
VGAPWGSRYLGKHPRNPDPEAGRRLKAVFAASWQKHFLKLNQLVNALHCDEFKNVVRLADQEHIWNYAALAEYQLPYIFATLMDYPSTNSLKINGVCIRKCWFRCWFESTITRYDDLWIIRFLHFFVLLYFFESLLSLRNFNFLIIV